MTAPKPPSPKKVNPYEGMTSDPEFAAAAKELGFTDVNKDHEVAAVKELLLKNTIDAERRDKSFRRAENQLYKEGILVTNDPFTDKKSWKDHYIQKNNLDDVMERKEFRQQYIEKKGLEGPNKKKKANEAYDSYLIKSEKKARKAANEAYNAKEAEMGKNFIHSDDTDTNWELQKIYDRMYDNEAAKAQKKSNKALEKQANLYIEQQEKAQKAAQKQFKKQMKAQKESQDAMAQQQKELMEQMMDQPIYSARQAALPKVQYKAKTPEPTPVAPAPPPTMNITPAPAPELVNIGNPMGIVRQSKTTRSRSRQRTRGTSTLRN